MIDDVRYIRAVHEKIEYRPRLIPILSHTLNIPERVYEYSPDFFICFNVVGQRYELHSLDQEINSYCATLPYKDLDARSLRWIWKNDIRVHGAAIYERMDRNNEKLEKRKDREWRNWIQDVAGETKSMFAKDAWTM